MSVETPRTFREVGIAITHVETKIEGVKKDIEKLSAKMDRFINVLIVSIFCPIFVSATLIFITKRT